jgi:GT2 family glycosyltransferase
MGKVCLDEGKATSFGAVGRGNRVALASHGNPPRADLVAVDDQEPYNRAGLSFTRSEKCGMGDQPRIARVVIPAFRAVATIKECVSAVARSTADAAIEIVVVDDGENPGLGHILSHLPVTIKKTGGSGSAAVARNLGAADFPSGVLLFVDADVVVRPNTLQLLISPILEGKADAVVGNYSQEVSGHGFAAKYKQLYISCVYDRRAGYLHNDFWTAVGAIDASTFYALGGFDQSVRGACGEDGELGVRLTAAGRRIIGLPGATGRHLHKLDLQNLIVNDWHKGRIALQNRAASKGRLSDNKHAGPRDILSVILAVVALGAVPGAFCAMIGPPVFWALPMVIAFGGYVAARCDVMARFATQGLWFSFRAFWVMLTLDLVRCACVLSRVFETKASFPSCETQWRSTENV